MLNFDFLKKVLGLVSAPNFVHEFSTTIFAKLYFINWPCVIVWLPWLFEIFDNMCIVIVSYRVCDVINFEICVKFLVKPFSYMTENWNNWNLSTKIEISQEQKELTSWNKKHFLSFLKDFQLPEIVSDLRMCL